MKIEDPVRMVRVQRLRATVVLAGMMVWGLVVIDGATPQTIFAEPSLNWGDQSDGTYRNPILPADYSDPDAIRVGNDFYLVASDFHFVGMQVLHSRSEERR